MRLRYISNYRIISNSIFGVYFYAIFEDENKFYVLDNPRKIKQLFDIEKQHKNAKLKPAHFGMYEIKNKNEDFILIEDFLERYRLSNYFNR